jgi:hypothetical protein
MRWRAPRLPITGEVQTRLVPSGARLVLLDISLEGFAAESPIAFALDIEYEFEFSSLHCTDFRHRAVNVHCGRVIQAGPPLYVAGFSFAPTIAAAGRERVAALIRDVHEFRSISRE